MKTKQWVIITQNIFGGPKTVSKPFDDRNAAFRMARMWQTTRPMWSVVVREVEE